MTDDAPIPVFTIVPAQPGWFVAIFIPAGEDYAASFSYEPIIAWKIDHERRDENSKFSTERYHVVIPIGTEGNLENYVGFVYKRPDGVFDVPADRQIENEAEALEYCQKQYDEAKALNRKRAETKT